MNLEIAAIITALAEYYSKNLSDTQLEMYTQDLSDISPEALKSAAVMYRTNPKNSFFPLPGALREILLQADGRPGVEEAWSMAPKDETSAAFINEEIMDAWNTAEALLADGDTMVSARMAFKEVYERRVRESRDRGVKPKWWLSRAQGSNRDSENDKIIRDAIQKGRLTEPEARVMLPDFGTARKQTLLGTNARMNPDIIINSSDTFNSIGEIAKKLQVVK